MCDVGNVREILNIPICIPVRDLSEIANSNTYGMSNCLICEYVEQ